LGGIEEAHHGDITAQTNIIHFRDDNNHDNDNDNNNFIVKHNIDDVADLYNNKIHIDDDVISDDVIEVSGDNGIRELFPDPSQLV